MKYTAIILMIIVTTVIIPTANAQQIQINYEDCDVIGMSNRVYVPFEIRVEHESTIAQRVTDKHPDNPNAQLGVQRPERASAEDATWITLRSDEVARWEIQLDLQYLIEKDDEREVTVKIFSKGQNILTQELSHSGKFYCLVFNLVTSEPPPPQLTDEQISEIAGQQFADELRTNNDNFLELSSNYAFLSNVIILLLLVVTGAIVFTVIENKRSKIRYNAMINDLAIEKEGFESATRAMERNDQYSQLKINDMINAFEDIGKNFYNKFNDLLAVALDMREKNIKMYEKYDITCWICNNTVEVADAVNWGDGTLVHKKCREIHQKDSKKSKPDNIPVPEKKTTLNVISDSLHKASKIKELIKHKSDNEPKDKNSLEYAKYLIDNELKDIDSDADKDEKLSELWDKHYSKALDSPNSLDRKMIDVLKTLLDELREKRV